MGKTITKKCPTCGGPMKLDAAYSGMSRIISWWGVNCPHTMPVEYEDGRRLQI